MPPKQARTPGTLNPGASPLAAEVSSSGTAASSPVGGAGSAFTVDSSSVTALHKALGLVISDITTLGGKIDSLTSKLNQAAKAAAAVTKSMPSGQLTTATGSFRGTGPSAGALTTAGFSAGKGAADSGGAKTTTTAIVTGGRSSQSLAIGAGAEVAAQFAGATNTYMSNLQSAGLPIDLMARQGLGIFGGTAPTNAQAMSAVGRYTGTSNSPGISNLGAADLGSAMAQMQANPYLFAAPGSQKTAQIKSFMNSVTALNPLMGASGAASMANTLASGPMLQMIQRYTGSSGGALLRPATGSNPLGINSPSQVYQKLLQTVTLGRSAGMNASQMKASFGSGAQATANWSSIDQMFGEGGSMGTNLSPSELLVLRQYAASGGNLSAAENQVKGSVATSTLKKTTAGTKVQMTGFEAAAGSQKGLNQLATDISNLETAALQAHPGMAAILNDFAKGASILTHAGAGVGGTLIVLDAAKSVAVKIGKVLGGLLTNPAVDDAAESLGDPTGSTTTSGLQPNLAHGITAMQRANPRLRVTSGHRTSAQQANLYNMKGGHQVARPGHSLHERGQAADMGPRSQFGWIAKNAAKFGLHTPDRSEPWHVQTMGDAVAKGVGVTGAEVVQKALPWEGTSYVWGGNGTSPGQGVDCSRFVQEVYASLGITLPRTTFQQVAMGSAVGSLGSAQPGDLLFYAGSDGTPDNPGHVAIYVGHGKQIAAPETGQVVQIQQVDAGSVVAIRRVVGGGAGSAVAAAASAAVGNSKTNAVQTAATAAPSIGLQNTFIGQVGSSWLGSSGGGATIPTTSVSASGTANTTTTPAAATGAAVSTAAMPANGGGAGGYVANAAIVNAVKAVTSNKDVQIAMLTGAALESSQQAVPSSAGGGYGPWQIQLAAHPGITAQMAQDPMTAARLMLNGGLTMGYAASTAQMGGLWQTNPQSAAVQAAALAELPAHGSGPQSMAYVMNEPGNVGPAYNLAVSEVGDPALSMSSPAGPASVSRGTLTMPGGGGGNSFTINIPLQVVGVSQEDAQKLAQLVFQAIKAEAHHESVSNG